MKIACIGVGLIGKSWTVAFARAGNEVAIWDPKPEAVTAALTAIRTALRDLREAGATFDPDDVMARVRPARDLAEAVSDAEYVQESGPENLEGRARLFTEMDRLVPASAVLASSSSFFQTSLFADKVAGRNRCLVSHPVNPPHLIPLVEISGAPFTDDWAIDVAYRLMVDIQQVPVKILREIDGFVLNRIQAAVLSEMFKLVADGCISPDDADKTVQYGLAFRWSMIGPLAAIELNAPAGLQDYVNRGAPFFRRYLASAPEVSTWDRENTDRVVDLAARYKTTDELQRKMQERDIELNKMRHFVVTK